MDLISLTEMETSSGKGRDHSLLMSFMGSEDISLTMKSFHNPAIVPCFKFHNIFLSNMAPATYHIF